MYSTVICRFGLLCWRSENVCVCVCVCVCVIGCVSEAALFSLSDGCGSVVDGIWSDTFQERVSYFNR